MSLFMYFIVFFPLPFVPLKLHNHHTVVYVHESFFLFAQSLHPLTPPPVPQICQPALYL